MSFIISRYPFLALLSMIFAVRFYLLTKSLLQNSFHSLMVTLITRNQNQHTKEQNILVWQICVLKNIALSSFIISLFYLPHTVSIILFAVHPLSFFYVFVDLSRSLASYPLSFSLSLSISPQGYFSSLSIFLLIISLFFFLHFLSLVLAKNL